MTVRKALKISITSLAGVLLLAAASFFIIRRMDEQALRNAPEVPPSAYARPVLLPSLFTEGARFYFKLPIATGDTALAFGDTGGGISMVSPLAVGRLHLKPFISHALLRGLMPVKYIPFRRLVPDEQIPAPLVLNSFPLRRPYARLNEPFLMVMPDDEEGKMITQVMPFDLFLGQNFFMGRSWTLDYENQQLWVNTPLSAREATMPGMLRLGFAQNGRHEALYGHPSMQIEVDGEPIDVLFDTGASIILSEEGKKMLGTAAKTIAGSFIAKSIADRWRQRHPDWKYYPKADMSRDVIEVPEIKVAGYTAGPVLFAVRDDRVWSEGMVQTMDKVVKGALGGSGLKYFKVMIDYNSRLAKFQQ